MSPKRPPQKQPNKQRRSREYFTPDEIETLIKTAKSSGRYSHRDSTMILVAYRHGLRISELITLQWEQINLKLGIIHINRRKNGISCSHPLYSPEIRALRKIRKMHPEIRYVFITERKGPMTDSNFRKIFARIGKKANFEFPIHPHMLRHSTGFKLANDGLDTRAIQQYLGHKNIQYTVKYTELNSNRFNNFWND